MADIIETALDMRQRGWNASCDAVLRWIAYRMDEGLSDERMDELSMLKVFVKGLRINE